MDISSLISSRQREKPRIFTKPYAYTDSSGKNNSQSQPILQTQLESQKQIPQEVPDEQTRQNRPQSLYQIEPSYDFSPKNKSVQITLLKLENRREKQENEKMREIVEKLKKELKDKVEMLQKFNDLMKIKYAEIKTLKTEVETANTKITEIDQQNHQLQLQTNQLQKINNQLYEQNNSLQKQNSQLSLLQNQLEQKNKELREQNHELHFQQEQLQKELQQQQEQLQNQLLQQQELKQQLSLSSEATQKIKFLYISKSSQLDSLLSKLKNSEHDNFANQLYEMKISQLYDELDEEKGKNNTLLIERSQLMQTLNELKEKVELLEYENQKIATIDKTNYQSERIQKFFTELNQMPLSSSPTKQSKQTQHLNAFQEALKVQLKQIQQLKKTIQNSQQIIQTLKDSLFTSRRELEELRGEMRITFVKETTERKKLIMEYRLQLHEKDNQINNLSKKFKTLDEKYKAALNDIKAKDDFFRQHLLGRLTDISAKQYVDSVLRKYTQNFDQLLELKTQITLLNQKSQQYLKYEQEVESVLQEYKKPQ